MLHDAYKSLGTNPSEIPDGNWVRVHVSATGNYEIWVEHSLKLSYSVICD